MKKALILATSLLALFLTVIPAGAATKYPTFAYVTSARSGTTVHINGLVNIRSSVGIVRSAGRTVSLQRLARTSWQTLLHRTSDSDGRISVTFVQPGGYRYRLSVTETRTALGARSAVTALGSSEPPTTPPPPFPPQTSGTVISNAYTTAYGWPDNSPPGPVVSGSGTAGGTGTFDDPITIAVGYVGNVPDYPYGTKFYVPNVRRYFVVQDTCAECHRTPSGASTWVDLWAGGDGSNDAGVLACENTVTGNFTIIRNPDANRPVVAGPLYDGRSCTAQFGG